MIAVGKDVFHFLAHQGGAHGQAAGQSLGGRNHIRLQTVLHIGVHGAGTAVAGLHFVHHEQDILLLQEGSQLFHEIRIQGDDAAFTLYHLDENRGDSAVSAKLFQRIHISGRERSKAGSQRLEEFVEVILSGGGQGGQGPAMEALLQRHNSRAGGSFVFRSPFPGNLDGAFIGFCSGIGEEHLGHAGLITQGLGQVGTGSSVEQVRHMLNAVDLLFNSCDPFVIRYTEGGDCDA